MRQEATQFLRKLDIAHLSRENKIEEILFCLSDSIAIKYTNTRSIANADSVSGDRSSHARWTSYQAFTLAHQPAPELPYCYLPSHVHMSMESGTLLASTI